MSHPLRGFFNYVTSLPRGASLPGVRLFLPAGRLRPPAAGFSQQCIGNFCRDFSHEIHLCGFRVLLQHPGPQAVRFPVSPRKPPGQHARGHTFSISCEGGRRSFAGIATKTVAAGVHWLETIHSYRLVLLPLGFFIRSCAFLSQWCSAGFPLFFPDGPQGRPGITHLPRTNLTGAA